MSAVMGESSASYLVISVVLFTIVLATMVGNFFVIIAILVYKHLQTSANQLVLSLAVADLMVACLVMPLGAYNDLQQGWYLGELMCEFWTSADVLCCTASILNLLAIALDRFWAVTNVDYIYRRTKKRVNLMILCAWTVGAVVSLAPIFGWKDPDFARRVLDDHKCLVSQDVAYQIFATVSTFYLPLVLLLALYWRIFQVARKRIRRKPGDKLEAQQTQQLQRPPQREPQITTTAASNSNNNDHADNNTDNNPPAGALPASARPNSRVGCSTAELAGAHQAANGAQAEAAQRAPAGAVAHRLAARARVAPAEGAQSGASSPTRAHYCCCSSVTSAGAQYALALQADCESAQNNHLCTCASAWSSHCSLASACSSLERLHNCSQVPLSHPLAPEGSLELFGRLFGRSPSRTGAELTGSSNGSASSSSCASSRTDDDDADDLEESSLSAAFPPPIQRANVRKCCPPEQPARSPKRAQPQQPPPPQQPLVHQQQQPHQQRQPTQPQRLQRCKIELKLVASEPAGRPELPVLLLEPKRSSCEYRSLDIRRRFRALGQLVSFVQTSRTFHSTSSSAPTSQSGDERDERRRWQSARSHAELESQPPSPLVSLSGALKPFVGCPAGSAVRQSGAQTAAAAMRTQTLLMPAPASSQPARAQPANSQAALAGGLVSRRRANLDMRREKKAAKTLAIITGVFVCCWLPFFLNALLMATCGSACTPSDLVLSILLWLGYLNSLLNPIIYTIFSPDFRRAFRRLLCLPHLCGRRPRSAVAN